MPPKKKKDKLPAITQLPSGAYRTQIYLGKDPATGKKIVESFSDPDYDVVARWALDRIRDREQSAELHKTPGKMTLGEAIDAYIASKSAVLSPATIREYRGIRRRNLEELMPLPINRITQNDVQAAINREALTLSPKTLRNHHGLITAVLGVYRPELQLRTTLPKKVKPDIYVPTDQEIKSLCQTVKDTPMEIPIILAACCGMRRSEICSLKWSNINFKKNTMTIRSARVYNDEGKIVEKETKTTAGKRTIPIMSPVRNALLRAHEAVEDDNTPLTSMTPNSITNAFPHRLNAAGINHFRFHDLRHYVVSLMIFLNIPKKYIADYVGHENEKMIDQVYGHVMKDKKATFTDRLDEYLTSIHDDSLPQ